MGVRGVPTADIVFEDVRVPRENLIGGEEGQGFNHAMLTLNSCRPVVGARGVGLAEGAMTYALEFARKREAFGKPIADLQAIQFMFADMAIADRGGAACSSTRRRGASTRGCTSASTRRTCRSRRRSRRRRR